MALGIPEDLNQDGHLSFSAPQVFHVDMLSKKGSIHHKAEREAPYHDAETEKAKPFLDLKETVQNRIKRQIKD